MKNKSKSIILEISYDKLYFQDIIYIFNSLVGKTKAFYSEDKYWFDDIVYTYLIDNNIKIEKEEFYKLIPSLKEIVRRSINYQINSISEGSLVIQITLAVIGSTLVPLVSTVGLPQGIAVGVVFGIVQTIYAKYEKEFDNMLNRFEKSCSRRLSKREDRNIKFKIKNGKEIEK